MEYELILVRVFVTDFERAVRFYTETLEMPLGFRSDEMGWAQLPLGGSQLALERAAPDDAEAQELVGRFLGLSLEVPDVLTTFETLSARGVEFLNPPGVQPWGGMLTHFRDPDGNVLTLLGSAKSE